MTLRPRLATGLPLSQRAPLPREEMHPRMCRLTQLWVGGQGFLRQELAPSRQLPCCLYSLGCLEGVFSETRLPVSSILGNSGHEEAQGWCWNRSSFAQAHLCGVSFKIIQYTPSSCTAARNWSTSTGLLT